jgi:hypothetical protein
VSHNVGAYDLSFLAIIHRLAKCVSCGFGLLGLSIVRTVVFYLLLLLST